MSAISPEVHGRHFIIRPKAHGPVHGLARRACVLLPLAFALAACSTQKAAAPSSGKTTTSSGDVGDVLSQPLVDLNISGAEIPALLDQAASAPYAPPGHADCNGLQSDIDRLSEVLGPDLAERKTAESEPILTEDSAADAAWGAARSAATGWIPFRGVVRFITGAERRERRGKEAVLAGFVRRAYLKGLRESLKCPVAVTPDTSQPAAPTSGAGMSASPKEAIKKHLH